MSKYRARLGSRKYYKRCLNLYAWEFRPTGAIQPRGFSLPSMGSVRIETSSMTWGELSKMINEAMQGGLIQQLMGNRNKNY